MEVVVATGTTVVAVEEAALAVGEVGVKAEPAEEVSLITKTNHLLLFLGL